FQISEGFVQIAQLNDRRFSRLCGLELRHAYCSGLIHRRFLTGDCPYLRLAVFTAIRKGKCQRDGKRKNREAPSTPRLIGPKWAGLARERERRSMFFVVSKVFWLLVQPLSIVLVLLALGVAFLAIRRRVLASVSLVLATLVLAATGFTTLGYMLIQPLEDRIARPAEMPERAGAIVMLGGATLARPSSARMTA